MNVDQQLLLWTVIPALILVFLACLLGVRSRMFDDTLLQRLGLATVALGTLAEVSKLVQEGHVDPHRAALYLGLGLYASATTIKFYRRWRAAGRPGHPFRRSTDSTDFAPDSFVAQEQTRRSA